MIVASDSLHFFNFDIYKCSNDACKIEADNCEIVTRVVGK